MTMFKRLGAALGFRPAPPPRQTITIYGGAPIPPRKRDFRIRRFHDGLTGYPLLIQGGAFSLSRHIKPRHRQIFWL